MFFLGWGGVFGGLVLGNVFWGAICLLGFCFVLFGGGRVGWGCVMFKASMLLKATG